MQRKVGFEFETTWPLRKPTAVKWNTDSPIAKGKGWQLSPDELDGNQAVIEFKTVPFEVEGDDTSALSKAVVDSIGDLKSYGDKLVALTTTGAVPEAAASFRNVTVTPKADRLAARPQVTGGVRQDLVINFLHDATKAKDKTSGADLMPSEARKSPLRAAGTEAVQGLDLTSGRDKKYAGTVALLAFYIRRAYERHESVMSQIAAWRSGYVTAMYAADPATKEAMSKAFNAKKVKRMKELAPSYAKGIASVLPRERFSKLPEISRPTLLADVVRAAGMKEFEAGKQAWPTGLKSLEGEWGRYDETIGRWIEGLQAEDPAGRLQDADFWGEREIAAGNLGQGAEQGPGILFELRGQDGGVTYDNYLEFAKPYLLYFRKLNLSKKPANA